MTDADDWELALLGNTAAFGRVFDRHRGRLSRHCHRLVTIPSDVDDVVSIVFFEAWRKRNSVRFVDGSILPWLLVTATNTSRNLERGKRRYRAVLDRLPVAAHSIEFSYEEEGEAQTALRLLPIRDQQILTLCVIEGFTEAEAASVLAIARGTVKSRLSRAKRRLVEQMTSTSFHPRQSERTPVDLS